MVTVTALPHLERFADTLAAMELAGLVIAAGTLTPDRIRRLQLKCR